MSVLRVCLAVLVLANVCLAEIKNKGWYKNTIFYQIYPRSFMDSNDDGIGDLQGIARKLDHFKQAGIGAIWLSPIYASPQVDFGYDISDFRKIDEKYGTMSDFEYLTKKAKKLGLKVILDLVPNHTSDKHEWFIRSFNNETKYRDYYIWHTGKNSNKDPPNNWISVFSGPAWTFNGTRKQWYFHQFEYRQPDLNYANPEVQKEMIEVIKFWLGKGVDGFRVDAVPHIFENDKIPDEPRSSNTNAGPRDYTFLDHIYTKDDQRTYTLIESWRKVMDEWADKNNETEKVMMTEAYTSLYNTTKFYRFGTQIPFNFKFITDIGTDSKPADYKRAIDEWMASMKSLNNSDYVANWVMGNHDRPRIASRFPANNGEHLTILALTLPGVAVTYYGEEIDMVDYRNISWEDTQDPQACNAGKDKYLERSRDPNRTPMQWDTSINAGFNEGGETWLPVHNNYHTVNVATQMKTVQSPFKLYQALTSLKSKSAALIQGDLTTQALNDNNVLAIIRNHDDEGVAVLVNFAPNKEQTVNLTGHVPSKFKSATIYAASTNVQKIAWGTKVKLDAVKLPASGSYVLKTSTEAIKDQGNGALGVWTASFVTLALSLAAQRFM